jgi:putative ABC transport system permease protein
MNFPGSDLRQALRMQLKRKGFTLLVVLTLALGIGVNTAIFSLFNAVVWKALPYKDSNRLLILQERNAQGALSVAYPVYQDWRIQSTLFQQMAAVRPGGHVVFHPEGAEQVSGKWISAGFFSLLGEKMKLGREFLPSEDAPGGNAVAIISHEFWRRNFAGSSEALGKPLNIDGTIHSVVGVLPPGFQFNGSADIFLPLSPVANGEDRNIHNAIFVVARLKPGVSVFQVQDQMSIISRRLAQQYPSTHKGETVDITSLNDWILGTVRPIILIFWGAVGFILLIACVNVAGLMLVRVSERGKEFALRSALGASRWRMIRHLLLESFLLSLESGILGLLLSYWSLNSLSFFVPEDLIRRGISFDVRVMGFTLLLSLFTGVIFGIIPAFQASKTNLNEPLKAGGRSLSPAPGRQRFRRFLVASEVALACVLLIGAGLLLRSARGLIRCNPGFDTEDVLTLRISPPESRFIKAAEATNGLNLDQVTRVVGEYQNKLLERVRQVPGVESAATVFPLPVSGESCIFSYHPEGRAFPEGGNFPSAHYYVISPDYFKVMKIPLIQGRWISMADKQGALRVTVINKTMARQAWPNEDPVGRQFRLPNFPAMPESLTVVGVVGDTKHDGLPAPAPAQFYMSNQQWAQGTVVTIRGKMNLDSLAVAVQKEIAAFDKEVPVHDVRTMRQRLATSLVYQQRVTWLLTLFAAFALILTATGIYGVMAYSASQRMQEMGIRMALGAESKDILGLIVGEGVGISALGVILGIVSALVLTHLLSNLLFEVTATDPLTFAAIALLLATVAATASYIPARRASRVDPIVALHCD